MTESEWTTRLDEIRSVIDASGRAGGVTIIAVTKGFGRREIAWVRDAGLLDIGESYAQELLGKADDIPEGLRLHFIGRIQRNKVRKIADRVTLWHSVAREEVIRELGKRVEDARILVQITHDADPSKDGVSAEQLPALLTTADEVGVTVRGLMTIGIHGDPKATQAAFAATRVLAERHGLDELSMGMTDDYHIALDEGATMLRLGTALFGPRPSR